MMACSRCGAPRHRENFYYCKSCQREYQRAWQQANRDRQALYRANLAARIAAGLHVPQPSGPGRPGRPRSVRP